MPTKNRFGLDKHPAQSRPIHPPTERGDDRPIGRAQLQPLDLTAHNAKLVPKEKQLRHRVVDSKLDIKQIESQAQQRVNERKEHRRFEILIGQLALLRVACPPMNM